MPRVAGETGRTPVHLGHRLRQIAVHHAYPMRLPPVARGLRARAPFGAQRGTALLGGGNVEFMACGRRPQHHAVQRGGEIGRHEPGVRVGQHLNLLSVYMPGYSVSVVGALVGFVYAFVIGYGIGRTIGTVYNKLVTPMM